MTESEFLERAEAALQQVETAIDAADVDIELSAPATCSRLS